MNSNLRQLVQAERLAAGLPPCRCIRCREVGARLLEGREVREDRLVLVRRDYDAAGGREVFISFEDPKADAIAGVRWHLIGHLQRNKLDKTIPLVTLVHSVDSVRVLEALGAFGTKRGTPVRVLLEVNCSREDAKGGFRPDEVSALGDKAMSLPGVQLDGLMTMAANHDDPQLCRPTFIELHTLRDHLRSVTGLSLPHLSMGMSNDFEVAIEHGATFVRLGSTLFEGQI